MTYTLMVSHNCGGTYVPVAWIENPKELDSKCDELNTQGLRWAIEDENDNPVYRTCAIHAGIFVFLEQINANSALKEAE